MTRPFFSGRIPQSLYNALEEYRQQTNESKTDILIKALSKYVDHPVDVSFSSQSITVENERIADLEKKLEVLNQEFLNFRQTFAHYLNNFAPEEQHSEIDKETKEEVAGQISLILEESVIGNDNNADNNDPKESTNREDDVIKADNYIDNQVSSALQKVLVGTMKTGEVIDLPGLENEDKGKLRVKLNNTRATKTGKTEIGNYTVVLSEQTTTTKAGKKQLLWNVYKNENELAEAVINSDNTDDN